MSVLLAIGGLIIAFLFAAAGYRATNDVRFQEMRDRVTHHGRVQALYDSVRGTKMFPVTSFLKNAVVAKSGPRTSHC